MESSSSLLLHATVTNQDENNQKWVVILDKKIIFIVHSLLYFSSFLCFVKGGCVEQQKGKLTDYETWAAALQIRWAILGGRKIASTWEPENAEFENWPDRLAKQGEWKDSLEFIGCRLVCNKATDKSQGKKRELFFRPWEDLSFISSESLICLLVSQLEKNYYFLAKVQWTAFIGKEKFAEHLLMSGVFNSKGFVNFI